MKAIGGAEGFAIGPAFVLKKKRIEIEKYTTQDSEGEISRFREAERACQAELDQFHEQATRRGREEEARRVMSQKMMLGDPEFVVQVYKKIEEELLCASWAIEDVSRDFVTMFESMESIHMRERALDIRELAARLQRHIHRIQGRLLSEMGENSILVADELSPADILLLDTAKLAGLVVERGGKTSHVAILAKTLEIPAVLGASGAVASVGQGDTVAVDGTRGSYVVNPSQEVLALLEEEKTRYEAEKKQLRQFVGRETRTRDGFGVRLEANLSSLDDLHRSVENDAEGIGLMRTEFLFLGRREMPSEQEQYEAYRRVAEAMDGRPVVIRTMDVGGDKEVPYFDIPQEANPFLGMRAIRFCLRETGVFKTQLRAMLRAGRHGDIRIMLPMISSLEEFFAARRLLTEAGAELEKEGIPFRRDMPLGVMVEVPSLALLADRVARHVDFFSIGTNDLMQYTYAADRMNDQVEELYSPFHPVLYQLIKRVIDAAAAQGIPVALCGQIAGEPLIIPLLLALGLPGFSVVPTAVLKTRKTINSLRRADWTGLAERVLAADSATGVEEMIRTQWSKENGTG